MPFRLESIEHFMLYLQARKHTRHRGSICSSFKDYLTSACVKSLDKSVYRANTSEIRIKAYGRREKVPIRAAKGSEDQEPLNIHTSVPFVEFMV
jgi:hypothetical protein